MRMLEIEIPTQTLDHLDMEPSEFAMAMKTMAGRVLRSEYFPEALRLAPFKEMGAV
ncbi:MAG: hypothetical protein ACREOH_11580 [Candidatus Entotheonellia bacterium]